MADSENHPRGGSGPVSRGLFTLTPDRDERMQQVAMEMLLTLHQNDYRATRDPASPRRASLLLRSLVFGENLVDENDRYAQLGTYLSAGEDFAGSDGMAIVKRSLAALVDPATVRGSLGTQLMLPVHASLLWYDARRRSKAWRAQYVLMRGTGITLARFLLDPPAALADLSAQAAAARTGIKAALSAKSPYEPIVGPLARVEERQGLKREEQEAWDAADDPALAELGRRIIRHSAAIVSDTRQPPEVRLLNFRRIVALDVAWHMLNAAWEAGGVQNEHRYLTVCHAPQERSENRTRVLSEESYLAANQALTRGLLAEIRKRMVEHDRDGKPWDAFFLQRRDAEGSRRNQTAEYNQALASDLERWRGTGMDWDAYAARAFDAPGDGYNRPVGAFRVMLESCGLVIGTGRWRYLRAAPGLLAAMVAARPSSAAQEAGEFLAWLQEEWSLVIGEQEARSPRLKGEGAALQRNAEYFERDLVDAGLATALSDQTCMVAMKR